MIREINVEIISEDSNENNMENIESSPQLSSSVEMVELGQGAPNLMNNARNRLPAQRIKKVSARLIKISTFKCFFHLFVSLLILNSLLRDSFFLKNKKVFSTSVSQNSV